MHPPVRLRPMGGDGDSGARRAGSGRGRSGHAASAGAQAVRTLGLVTAALPHGEPRSGQADMAEAVAEAVVSGRHLVVQAGTGTGKSLAYLIPAILSGRPTIVATATKALQDQLATKDLPFLAEQLDVEFTWAVLKGRSNYLCLQRVREVRDPGAGQLELEDLLPSNRHEVERLATWAATTTTGDRAELDWSPSERAWAAVSVSSEECPGAQRCPLGEPCFAETARRRAAAADVVVVNTHLYGIDVGSGGAILPEHEVVVIDEAHQLEDITSDTAGLAIGAGRFANLARLARRILADPELLAAVADAGTDLGEQLAPWSGQLLPSPLPGPLAASLSRGRLAIDRLLIALRSITTDVAEADQRRTRAQKAAATLAEDVDAALVTPEGAVAWVGGRRDQPRLEVAPLDVAPVLSEGVWSKRTAILTTATVPVNLPDRVGLPSAATDLLDVGSPFEYEEHALLYCAAHLPDPRQPAHQAGVHAELQALITAAGGRTLALFTSRRAMQEAAAALSPLLDVTVLTQDDLPKPALLARFTAEETSCLFATAGLFQGIDVPGRTLSLVTIDRLPFPRPDEPLLKARRERLGPAAFRGIDLPRAATLLAQAGGRLIRRATDRGVFAVLDPRLASAGYRWEVVRALPPMRRTRRRDEVEAFLREITAAAP
jgi:ATP-dependent DNA helicase DinG